MQGAMIRRAGQFGAALLVGLLLLPACAGLGVEGLDGISITYNPEDSGAAGAAATAVPAATAAAATAEPTATVVAAAQEGICGRSAEVLEWLYRAARVGVGEECGEIGAGRLGRIDRPLAVEGRIKPGDLRGLRGVRRVSLRDCGGELRGCGLYGGGAGGIEQGGGNPG